MKKSLWNNCFSVLIILATEVLILNVLVVGSNLFFLIIGFQFSLCIAGNKILSSGIGDGMCTFIDSFRSKLQSNFASAILVEDQKPVLLLS